MRRKEVMAELKFEVKQTAGVISADFAMLKNKLSEKMEEYKAKEFSEDCKKEAKDDVAYLRKFKKSVSERNSEVRKAYMQPYEQFNDGVKELLAIIDQPINYIDGQVKAFEEKRVQQKQQEIKAVYEEIIPIDLEDYLPLVSIYGSKWNNAGTTIKSIRQELTDLLHKTKTDIDSINSMNSEKVSEALKLYMGNRDLACAMRYIADYESKKAEILKKQERQNEEKLERERQAEIERVRREERERIAEEERIRKEANQTALAGVKTIDESAAAPLTSKDSIKAVYTVVGTEEELAEIEMALTSLGVYFERKDV